MSKLLIAPGILDKNESPVLEWSDVFYAVTNAKGQERTILRGVSGKLRRGKLTAIIGPSGIVLHFALFFDN